jgi:hypothetical protein
MRKTTLLLTMLFLGLFGTVHAADDGIIQWFFGTSTAQMTALYTNGDATATYPYDSLETGDIYVVRDPSGFTMDFYTYDSDSAETEDEDRYFTPNYSANGIAYTGDARWCRLTIKAHMVIGTNVLAPDGDGSSLTGLTWSQIGSTPTTLSGYGITDGATATSLHLDDVLTALGIASEDVHFGEFAGTTIDDNLTAKAIFQALESAFEGLAVELGQVTEVTEYCDTADLEKLHAITVEAAVINADKPVNKGADITVTVGSGGDYSTINDALAALSAYYPLYVSGGFTAEISLLSGFVMAEQVIVSGIDLSWITITSVDAEVMITRSALTTDLYGRYPVFGVSRGRLPVIGALFSMDTSGEVTHRDGVFLADGSVAVISTGCGVKNAGATGLNCYKVSHALADGANFSGGDHCIACSRGSHVTARDAVLTGATTRGIYANEGGYIVAVSANCQKGASPAATDIVVGNGSTIAAINATGGLSQTANTVTKNGIIFQ